MPKGVAGLAGRSLTSMETRTDRQVGRITRAVASDRRGLCVSYRHLCRTI